MSRTVTQSYMDECAAEGRDGLRGVVDHLRFPPHFTAAFDGRVLGRPLFVEDSQIRDVADRLMRFHHLVVSLPGRLFDGDVLAYGEALGLDRRSVDILCRNGLVPPVPYGRADLHRDGDSWQLLEFNIGADLGGMERTGDIPRALMDVPRFREFAEAHQLSYPDIGASIARMLTRCAESVSAAGAPVVVMLESNGRMAKYQKYMLPFQEFMRGKGIDLRLAEVGQLGARAGKVHLDGTPVDVILRYVSVDQILADPDVAAGMEPVFRAHEEGRTVQLTPICTDLHGNKGILPMLHDSRLRAALTASELSLVDGILPWTRSMADPKVDVDGHPVDLVDYCRAHRADLILKPNNDARGGGIVAGWESTDQDWHQALTSCDRSRTLVQRRAPAQPEPVADPATGHLRDWFATWGVYLTDEGYAGTYIRALSESATSAVVGWDALPQLTAAFSHPA
ncbi:hypothetical protein [Kutzneria sp. NPDC051319]|uniref:hypothetical protein n=1 Tax=Kutzneria sp. NPDC051319 TaxID=3155047 RepID=UPI0034452040